MSPLKQRILYRTVFVVLFLGLLMSACDKSERSFSLLSEMDSFQQNGNTFSQRKIDILWVIDNSGSMETSQANLVNNFQSFIQQFQTLGFDYHMAVTSTEAYLADPFYNNSHNNFSAEKGRFRNGHTGTFGYGLTGIHVMTPQNTTADVFKKNISIGTNGSGDERALSSMYRALTDSINTQYGFRRSDAFLAVIILADEDDFSGTSNNDDHTTNFNAGALNWVGAHNYNVNAPYLQPVSYYVGLMDAYAGSRSNYSVSAIHVDTAACGTALGGSRPVTQRLGEMAALTNGQSTSICGNFASSLQLITNSVIALASVFPLDRLPIENTIRVVVNGSLVPYDAANGWTYDATANSVAFHGSSIPQQGASISITYDPQAPKN